MGRGPTQKWQNKVRGKDRSTNAHVPTAVLARCSSSKLFVWSAELYRKGKQYVTSLLQQWWFLLAQFYCHLFSSSFWGWPWTHGDEDDDEQLMVISDILIVVCSCGDQWTRTSAWWRGCRRCPWTTTSLWNRKWAPPSAPSLGSTVNQAQNQCSLHPLQFAHHTFALHFVHSISWSVLATRYRGRVAHLCDKRGRRVEGPDHGGGHGSCHPGQPQGVEVCLRRWCSGTVYTNHGIQQFQIESNAPF